MEQWTTKRIVVLTLTVATVLYLVYYVPGAIAHFVGRVWDLLVILVLSTAMAVIVAPPVELLCRVKVPIPERGKRGIATILVLAVVGLLLWWLMVVTAAPLVAETGRIAAIVRGWLATAPSAVQSLLDQYGGRVPPGLVERASETVAQWTQGLLEYQFDFAKGALLRGWYLVELLIIPVLAFYFLTDGKALRAGTIAFLPRRYQSFVDRVLDDVGIVLDRYVRALVALCLAKAVLVGGALYLCGVSMYMTLGILAGVFRLAPVIGPLVAAIPCVAIPFLQYGSHTGLIVAIIYFALIFIDGKLITPIMLGTSATLHPVVVIIALLLGYEFMGVMGLLVAVPMAGIIRVVYFRYQETFGDHPDLDEPPSDSAACDPA